MSSTTPRARHSFLLALMQLVLFLLVSCASAAPSKQLVRRGGSSVSVIVPIVVVVVLVVIGLVITCGGRNFRSRLAAWSRNTALASGTVTAAGMQPTVLTAEQLVGTPPSTAPTRPARNRRARPESMRSTRSLPLYMKEPGDQEVVIFRGEDDMEDVTIQTTVILPTVQEHSEHSPDPSLDLGRSMSRSSAYARMVESGQDTPLLDGQESSDDHSHGGNAHLQPPEAGVASRASFNISSEDAAGLMASPEVLERGEAPPYFEAIGMDSGVELLDTSGDPTFPPALSDRAMPPSTQEDHRPSSPSERAESQASHHRANSRRISGFFGGLFHQRNVPSTPTPVRPSQDRGTHTREGSSPSILSVSSSPHGVPPNQSDRTHRPSHSGSGSVMSLSSSMFRARSNTLAREVLDSPSTISLNSISAPLSHTLVRTEFTYPKAGPTPQQMKLISSLDSFARFGVPYGADAVAYAASASRMSLNPPPEFEEVAGSSGNEASRSTPGVEGPSPNTESQPAPADENEVAPEQSLQDPESISAAVAVGVPESVRAVVTAPEVDSQRPLEGAEGPSTPAALEVPNTPKAVAPPSSYKAFAPPSISMRAPSRASSYTSFATAQEYGSAPSTPSAMNLAMTMDVSDTPLSPATPTTIGLETPTASPSSSPRIMTRHVHKDTDMPITSSPPHAEHPVEG